MAWGNKKVENQRKQFCEAILNKHLSHAEACRQFDVSRPTGYDWLNRYIKNGEEGLKNLSSARHTQGNAIPVEIENEILEMKYKFKTFGPRKILVKLEEKHPFVSWPGTTSIGKILDENGLVKKRKTRKRIAAQTSSLASSEESNDIWTMDFKGWALTEDQFKFDPFTLCDHYSRFLIKCLKLSRNDTEHVWAILDLTFREYGLPRILRSDNGPPFATTSPGRLSPLSIKLIKAGVLPEWIEPGKPQQNGRHERMHLTMKQEGFSKQPISLVNQAKKLGLFQDYYNFERPHEALKQKTPGSIYVPSSRSWNGRLRAIEYTDEYKIGRVSSGEMRFQKKTIFISKALNGENLGIKEEADGFKVYFGPIFLGKIIDGDKLEVIRRRTRKEKKLEKG